MVDPLTVHNQNIFPSGLKYSSSRISAAAPVATQFLAAKDAVWAPKLLVRGMLLQEEGYTVAPTKLDL